MVLGVKSRPQWLPETSQLEKSGLSGTTAHGRSDRQGSRLANNLRQPQLVGVLAFFDASSAIPRFAGGLVDIITEMQFWPARAFIRTPVPDPGPATWPKKRRHVWTMSRSCST